MTVPPDLTGADQAGAPDMARRDMSQIPCAAGCGANASCVSDVCVCDTGFTGDGASCTACTTCASGTFQMTACTATVDTVCAACETGCATCPNAGPGVCTACAATHFFTNATNPDTCTACTVCDYGFFASTACSASADTVCSACGADCDRCTDATTCTLCSAGFVSNGSGGCMAFAGLSLRIRGVSGDFGYAPRENGNHVTYHGRINTAGVTQVPNEGTCTGTGCDVTPTLGGNGVFIQPPATSKWISWSGCNSTSKSNVCYVGSLPAAVIATAVDPVITITSPATVALNYGPTDRDGRGQTRRVTGTCAAGATCTVTAVAGTRGVRIRPAGPGLVDYNGCNNTSSGRGDGVRECEVRDFPANITATHTPTFDLTINNAGDPAVVFNIYNRQKLKFVGKGETLAGTCTGATCTITLPARIDGYHIRPATPVGAHWVSGCSRVSRDGMCDLDSTVTGTIEVSTFETQVALTVTGITTGTFSYGPGRRTIPTDTCTGATCNFTSRTTFPRDQAVDSVRIAPSTAGTTAWTGCDHISGGFCYIESFPAAITANVTAGATMTLNVAGDTTKTFGYTARQTPGAKNAKLLAGTCTGATCVFTAPGFGKGLRLIGPNDGVSVTWDSGCSTVNGIECYPSSIPGTVNATVTAAANVTLNVTGDTTGTFEYLPRIRKSMTKPATGTCTGATCTIPGAGVAGKLGGTRIRPPAGKVVVFTGCLRNRGRHNACYAAPGATITAHVTAP